MTSTIVTKNSSTASAVPVSGDLTQGELAVNVTDKRLFTKNSGGTVVELGINPSSLTMTGGTANGVAYLNGSKVVTTGSALTFDGTNLGLGVTPSAWSTGKAFEIGHAGNAIFDVASSQLTITQNAYYNGGYKYGASTTASRYDQGGGSHIWYNAPSGTAGNPISFTQAMTLDASGNLGVGTTSPISAAGYTSLCVKNTTSGGIIQATDGTVDVRMQHTSTAGGIGTYSSHALTFTAASSERARIDSSGNLLVGLTSAAPYPTQGISIYGNNGGSALIGMGHVSGTASGNAYMTFAYNGSGIGSITQNGTTGVLYNIISDYRLKDVIGDVSGSGSRIDAIKPIEYSMKADGSVHRGFLAHQFKEVYPNSVAGDKDAMDEDGNPVYQQMQPSTAEAMADIFAELQSLRKRVAQLEGK
jgi:hypothetical protein